MAYRRTELMEERLAETRERIVRAALGLIARGGYRAASVAAVADDAGVATGSVYRHFSSKADLFAEVFRRASGRELAVVRAVAARPDARPTDRLVAALETFAGRALTGHRLAYALIAEPADPAVDEERLRFRRAYRDVFARLLREGIAAGELPEQDVQVVASALVGAMGEALVGPLSPSARTRNPGRLVEAIVRFCTRAISREVSFANA
jgi:AcrR family transcriptional regulator